MLLEKNTKTSTKLQCKQLALDYLKKWLFAYIKEKNMPKKRIFHKIIKGFLHLTFFILWPITPVDSINTSSGLIWSNCSTKIEN